MSDPTAVASVGDNCLDEYLDRPGTGQTSEPATFVGGNAVNVAVGVRALGRPAAYFGAVGDDEAGRRVVADLTARGVDVTRVRTDDGATGLTRIRLRPDGDRVFETEDFGTSAVYVPGAADLEALRGFAAVHLGLLTEPEGVRRALAGTGVLVTQDCSVTAGFSDLDIAFCSEAVAGDAAHTARKVVAAGARLCVVTRGGLGSIAHDGTRWWDSPAAPVEVVDTLGAGDSFIAGFIDDYLHTRDVGYAIRAATKNAARTCSHVGAW